MLGQLSPAITYEACFASTTLRFYICCNIGLLTDSKLVPFRKIHASVFS